MNYKSRKTTLLLFIIVLFLITSFLASANSQNISITNIWYKKLPNCTHLTIKASGEILEYEVSYLEEPERIVIDVKNANYSIDELVKNILRLYKGSVKQIRCGQFENEPIPITRFVVDLFQKSDYEVKLSSDKRLLYIDVYDYVEFKKPEEQIFTVTPVEGEVEIIEKEEEPKISLVDTVTTPITLNLKEAEVVDAVRALSEISGINMVVDDSVTGKITLNLKEVPFKDALDLILKIKGLDYTEVSNILIIAQKELIEGYKKPITRIFELKNASAEAAKVILDGYKAEGSKVNIVADTRLNTLIVTGSKEEIEKLEEIISTIDEELLTRTFKIDNAIDKDEIEAIRSMLSIIIPDEERRIIDTRQSEIIIKGTKEELKKVEELIPKLDKRATQMSIEIKIIEIDLTSGKELGIEWTSGGEEGQISLGEITLGGSFERYGLIKAKLLALQNEGKINILSNPKIHATNGKEAFIFSGREIPIIEKIKEEDGTTSFSMKSREEVGIRMSVTPWISTDGIINLVLRADKKYLGREVEPGIFIIETQQIAYEQGKGQAMIIRAYPDETVVVGGLIESTEEENIYKIPLLGDIPIIGELFKRTTKLKTKTQVIILITVHILDY
jgi:type II secretory pathway component GspD/PulD (secretin)